MNRQSLLIVVGICMLLIAVVAGGARASTIIVSDSFAGADGAGINTRTPDGVDLPGGKWISVDNPFGSQFTITSDAEVGHVNSSGYISISSAGAYVKPTQLTISGDLEVGTIGGNNLGVGLGFNANTSYSVSQEISLGANGDLNLAQTLIAHYNPANFSGAAFSTASFYHLSYDIDTTTGGVSNIVLSNGLGSQSYTVSTTVFTGGNTVFAGIFTNSSANGVIGTVDNFALSTPSVPEPPAVALLALGAIGLLIAGAARGVKQSALGSR